MLLWYLGVSTAFVWNVFRSPALDYRLVMLGSVLPLLDVLLGGPAVLHTLLFTVVLMGVIMLATRERRLLRRRSVPKPDWRSQAPSRGTPYTLPLPAHDLELVRGAPPRPRNPEKRASSQSP